MTQVQRENSRFRTLMAAQLGVASEELVPVVSSVGAIRTARSADERGEEVL